ncbi:PIN domain-containing protein [bacterium]|nr:PIN domain-containing protein [bacterium]
MKHNILVDTSIWIEFFNHSDSEYGELLEQLILDNRVVYTGVILAELLQGAKIEKEYHEIQENMAVFPFLESSYQTWLSVGKTAFSLRRKGLTLPLTDILIACLAEENTCQIFSLDDHFKKIPGTKLYNS